MFEYFELVVAYDMYGPKRGEGWSVGWAREVGHELEVKLALLFG